MQCSVYCKNLFPKKSPEAAVHCQAKVSVFLRHSINGKQPSDPEGKRKKSIVTRLHLGASLVSSVNIFLLITIIIHLGPQFASLSTGVWGFSSDPTPAVFLQKLRVHHRRGLRVLVPQRAHTERGGEVSTARSLKKKRCQVLFFLTS